MAKGDPAKLLYVEADAAERQAVAEMAHLGELRCELELARNVEEARRRLDHSRCDLMVVGTHLEDATDSAWVQAYRETPVIWMAATPEDALALRLAVPGAEDYLYKDAQQRHLKSLPLAVQKALERRCAQESIRCFRQIADSMRHVLWVTETHPERVLYVSPAFERLWGHRVDDIYADPRVWTQPIHPDDIPAVLRAYDAWLRAPRAEEFDVEYRLLQPDGSFRWICDRGSVVLGPDGKVERLTGIAEDITKRKLAEQQLEQAQIDLKRANAELEQNVRERTAMLQATVAELEHFSYTITHDMRAPLRAMQGFGRILLDECGECAYGQRRDYLRRIAEAAERMDKLITDVLQYSGVLRERFSLEPVDTEAVVRGILECYPEFQPPQAEIRVEGEFPVVEGNRAATTQCFANLLGNAVKFVRPGQTPAVRLWTERRDGRVRFWVEDEGIGIPKEYQGKIWEMFQKLSREYDGTGIGLALVKKNVERMGGHVGVESEPGQGSRFWFELRCATSPETSSLQTGPPT